MIYYPIQTLVEAGIRDILLVAGGRNSGDFLRLLANGTVFEKVRKLVPSGRGELEITDVNNAYIREGTMTFAHLEGWWTDAGTFDSLLRASNLVAQSAARVAKSEARDASSVA